VYRKQFSLITKFLLIIGKNKFHLFSESRQGVYCKSSLSHSQF